MSQCHSAHPTPSPPRHTPGSGWGRWRSHSGRSLPAPSRTGGCTVHCRRVFLPSSSSLPHRPPDPPSPQPGCDAVHGLRAPQTPGPDVAALATRTAGGGVARMPGAATEPGAAPGSRATCVAFEAGGHDTSSPGLSAAIAASTAASKLRAGGKAVMGMRSTQVPVPSIWSPVTLANCLSQRYRSSFLSGLFVSTVSLLAHLHE